MNLKLYIGVFSCYKFFKNFRNLLSKLKNFNKKIKNLGNFYEVLGNCTKTFGMDSPICKRLLKVNPMNVSMNEKKR